MAGFRPALKRLLSPEPETLDMYAFVHRATAEHSERRGQESLERQQILKEAQEKVTQDFLQFCVAVLALAEEGQIIPMQDKAAMIMLKEAVPPHCDYMDLSNHLGEEPYISYRNPGGKVLWSAKITPDTKGIWELEVYSDEYPDSDELRLVIYESAEKLGVVKQVEHESPYHPTWTHPEIDMEVIDSVCVHLSSFIDI